MKTIQKKINGVKHSFESYNESIVEREDVDYVAIYVQIIDGVKFEGIHKFWMSKKSGACYEKFIFQGVTYSSELQFAKAALESQSAK